MTNSLLFEGNNLEEVLSEAQLCFGPEVEIVAANRVRKGGVFGFFARESYEVWAHGPETVANPALAMLEREDGVLEDDSFQSMVAHAIAEQAPTDGFDSAMDNFFIDPGQTKTEPTQPSSGQAAQPTNGGGLALAERPEVADPTTQSAPVAVSAPVTPAAVALEDPPRGASIFDEPRQPRTDLVWAVMDRIEASTRFMALPTQGIVTFIGDASVALPLVQELGRRTGAWGSEVAVITRRQLDDVPAWLAVDDLADVATRAPRWRSRDGLVPVIIDESIEKPSLDWVATAIDALEPTQTRLVTEAWRLPEQVGRFSLRLGGIDALDLAQAGETIDPLGMLDLDMAIGSVEGRCASPELLVAVWLDRRRRD